MKEESRFLAGVSLLTLSLLIHGGVFYSLNEAATLAHIRFLQEEKKLRAKENPLEFEFIEAPPKVHPQAPQKTRKTANRDALNQDLTKDKSKSAVLPERATQGPAEQLAQVRAKTLHPFSPEIKPKPKLQEKKPQEEQEQKQPPSQEGKVASMTEPEIVNPKEKAQSAQEARQKEGGSRPADALVVGQDKINTQEMGRLKSPGAKLCGVTSFEATGSGMGEYMKNLKEKIWMAWFPYLAFKYPQDFHSADAVISLTLNAKGEVKIVRVVENSGSSAFASYCMEAIQRASSFGDLPKEILALVGKDELEIKFGFHYR